MLPRPLPTSLPLCLRPQLLSVEHLSQHARGVAAGKHSLKYQKREKGAFLFLKNKSNSTVCAGVELCADEGRSAALSGQVRVAPEAPASPYPGPEAAAHSAPPPSWCGARLLPPPPASSHAFLTAPRLPALPRPEQHLSLPLSPALSQVWCLGAPRGRGACELGPCLFTAVPRAPGPTAPGPCATESPSPGSGRSRPQDSASFRSSQHSWDFEESDSRTSSMPSLKSHSPWMVTQDSSGAPAAFHSDILSALMPLGGRVQTVFTD